MEAWTTAPDRPGYRCKTVERENVTLVIYRPILSEAEAAKAKEKARTALESVMRELIHSNNLKGETHGN